MNSTCTAKFIISTSTLCPQWQQKRSNIRSWNHQSRSYSHWPWNMEVSNWWSMYAKYEAHPCGLKLTSNVRVDRQTNRQHCLNCWCFKKIWTFKYMNKTNHLISSNSHPSAAANKAIHCLKWGRGGVTEPTEHHLILTKYEAVHPTYVSENYSSCTQSCTFCYFK